MRYQIMHIMAIFVIIALLAVTGQRGYTLDHDPWADNILRVPSEYPTIQEAINASSDGDTVLVSPGTYTGDGNRDISFLGKAITVKSQIGAEWTIIDCGGSEEESHRGFQFDNAEDSTSILRGFTIRNGYLEKK